MAYFKNRKEILLEKKKRLREADKRKTFLIGCILVAIIAVYASARLNWRGDARAFYFKAEIRNFNQYVQWISERYEEFTKKQLTYATTAYKRRTELTADISSIDASGMKNAEFMTDLIQRSKLIVDTRRQPQDHRAKSNLTLLLENTPFMDAELFSADGKLTFAVPVLLPDQYFSAELDRLDEVYDRFSIPVRPKRFINTSDVAQTLQFDKAAFNESAKKLGSVFSKQIRQDAVKYGAKRELTIAGQRVKGTEVIVTLDEASATALLEELAVSIAADETLLSTTHGNFAELSTMLDDAGIFRLFEYLDETGNVVLNASEKKLVDFLNVRKDFSTFSSSLKNAISNYVPRDGLKMTMVIDSAGNILDRVLELNMENRTESRAFLLNIHTGSSNTVLEDCRNRFLEIIITEQSTGESAGKRTELLLKPVFDKPVDDDVQGSIIISYTAVSQAGSKTGTDIHLDITGKTDRETLKRNHLVSYQVKMLDESGEGNLSGEWSSTTWKNNKLNTENRTSRIRVDASLPSFGIREVSAVIDLASEDKLGIDPVTLPDMGQINIINLNTASDQELEQIKMRMMASFGSFYLANKPVFDAIMGQ